MATDLIFVCFRELRLLLSETPVVFFKVTDLIVKLLELVLEGHNLVLGGPNGVVHASDIFVSLSFDIFLVSDSVLSGFELHFETLKLVLRCLVPVTLSVGLTTQLVDLGALAA